MNIYFVRAGSGDNYIMVETDGGILCSNCAPSGTFAGVDLYGEDGESIAKSIAAVIDPDINVEDLTWMGDPCYHSMVEWEAEQAEQEPFNRDELFPVNL